MCKVLLRTAGGALISIIIGIIICAHAATPTPGIQRVLTTPCNRAVGIIAGTLAEYWNTILITRLVKRPRIAITKRWQFTMLLLSPLPLNPRNCQVPISFAYEIRIYIPDLHLVMRLRIFLRKKKKRNVNDDQSRAARKNTFTLNLYKDKINLIKEKEEKCLCV